MNEWKMVSWIFIALAIIGLMFHGAATSIVACLGAASWTRALCSLTEPVKPLHSKLYALAALLFFIAAVLIGFGIIK
jgi:hypothetical protein